MNTNINRQKNPHLNCIENCLMLVCQKASIDHFPMFLKSWDFGYNPNKSDIGQMIHYHRNFDFNIPTILSDLKQYSGLQYINYKDITLEKIIYDLNTSNFLLVEIDSSMCNWSKELRSFEHRHFILLTKYDFESQTFEVSDPTYSSLLQYCSLDIYVCFKSVCSINAFNTSKTNLANIKEGIYIWLNNIINSNIFENINLFGTVLQNIDSDYFGIYPKSNLFNIPLIRRISLIMNGRMNFFELLKAVFGNNATIEHLFEQIINNWVIVRNRIAKSILSNNADMIKTCGCQINNIALKERMCAETLLDILNTQGG